MGFLGVKNRIKEKRTLTFDSHPVDFEPEQTIILEERQAAHADKLVVQKIIEADGRKILQLHKQWEIVPLDEALKNGAKMPESAAAIAERKRVAARKEVRDALKDEIKAEIIAEQLKSAKKAGLESPRGEKR